MSRRKSITAALGLSIIATCSTFCSKQPMERPIMSIRAGVIELHDVSERTHHVFIFHITSVTPNPDGTSNVTINSGTMEVLTVKESAEDILTRCQVIRV